jgi:hypothetical protein
MSGMVLIIFSPAQYLAKAMIFGQIITAIMHLFYIKCVFINRLRSYHGHSSLTTPSHFRDVMNNQVADREDRLPEH